jgi:hypothetical protein
MVVKRKISNIISRWPIALIILGGVLTALWISLLILLPLHLLDVR